MSGSANGKTHVFVVRFNWFWRMFVKDTLVSTKNPQIKKMYFSWCKAKKYKIEYKKKSKDQKAYFQLK